MTLDLNKNDVIEIITSLTAIRDAAKDEGVEEVYITINELCKKIVKQYLWNIQTQKSAPFEWTEE